MKERLRIQGLRKRWILNSVGPVILILVLAAILASATVANNYYGSARSTLEAKAKAGADYFNSYSMSSYSEYYRNASLYAASFDSTRIELQFLNLYGRVDNSTQGVAAGTAPQTPELARALESGSIEVFSGKDPVTGESVMAVTTPLKFNGSTVAFMRYVTATRQIDHQILLTILIISAIIAGVICLVLISSLLFINSVVAPVAEVTDAAKRISGGSYGIQLPNPYTDEMGELVDNINDMSLKISQSEKIQTEFISSVSHELRTPLTAINGWSETLLEDDDPAQLRRGLHIILKESRRLTNMVEELLEFSRIQDGRFTLSVEPMDIKAELEDAVYTYREFFRREGIELNHFDCDEEFPPIAGDPERLRQGFCNLLDNAAKHGGSGKRIDTAIARDEDQVVITIRDYGPGIPAEELPHVKYKFYKGSSKARGSGIGLAVCDEIITRHEGTLDIDNAEGGGCIVTIHLPIRAQAAIEQKF